ncbi:hypothetical protein CGRA01v4_05512 [Colletotrichum graminicola]|nr:hypothetical protein CGRA01v4_05512 [Colletotrichum graminicola]
MLTSPPPPSLSLVSSSSGVFFLFPPSLPPTNQPTNPVNRCVSSSGFSLPLFYIVTHYRVSQPTLPL